MTAVLDELWKNDKIETVYEAKDKTAPLFSNQKVYDFSGVYIALLQLSDSKEKATKFQAVIAEFGFDKVKITAKFIFRCIQPTTPKIKLFETLLMFHIQSICFNYFSQALVQSSIASLPDSAKGDCDVRLD